MEGSSEIGVLIEETKTSQIQNIHVLLSNEKLEGSTKTGFLNSNHNKEIGLKGSLKKPSGDLKHKFNCTYCLWKVYAALSLAQL